MLFARKIKELRMRNQIPQRVVAAVLNIDTATYCKIEKGERKAKRDQISQLSTLLNVDREELLALWLADKVTDIVSIDRQVASNALAIAAQNLNK